jgi:hypothetical protein
MAVRTYALKDLKNKHIVNCKGDDQGIPSDITVFAVTVKG